MRSIASNDCKRIAIFPIRTAKHQNRNKSQLKYIFHWSRTQFALTFVSFRFVQLFFNCLFLFYSNGQIIIIAVVHSISEHRVPSMDDDLFHSMDDFRSFSFSLIRSCSSGAHQIWPPLTSINGWRATNARSMRRHSTFSLFKCKTISHESSSISIGIRQKKWRRREQKNKR